MEPMGSEAGGLLWCGWQQGLAVQGRESQGRQGPAHLFGKFRVPFDGSVLEGWEDLVSRHYVNL